MVHLAYECLIKQHIFTAHKCIELERSGLYYYSLENSSNILNNTQQSAISIIHTLQHFATVVMKLLWMILGHKS